MSEESPADASSAPVLARPRSWTVASFAGLGGAATALLTWTYLPALRGPFLWDDHVLIEQDPRVRAGAFALRSYFASFFPGDPWSDARTAYFRPLVTLSLAANARISHDAIAFHVTNLVVHLVNVMLVALLAHRVIESTGTGGHHARPTRAPFLACAAVALLWGALPRLTEAVAWIAGRTDLLSTLFALLALVAWPLERERERERERKRDAAPAAGLRLRRGLATVSMLLALLCKEVAFAVPLAVIACELSRKLPARETIARLLGPVSAGLLYLVMRAAALAGVAAPHDRPNPHPLATPFEALGDYVQMIMDPWQPRAPIGMRGEPTTLFVALGGLAALIAAGATIGLVIAVRTRRLSLAPSTVLWAALAFFALAPTLQVLPIRLGGAVVADRFLYLPLAALAILAAKPANAQRNNFALAASAALFASFVTMAHARAAVFSDELTLWTTLAGEAHPHNTMPLGNLAALPAMSERPDLKLALTARVSRVLEATDRASSPTYRRARSNEIAALVAAGKYDEAAVIARALMTQFPDSAVVQAELGYAELHVGNLTDAAEAFERAYTLDPSFEDARRTGAMASELAKGGYRKTMTDVSPRVLGILGRRLEACAGYRAVARDPRAAPETRMEALTVLVRFDDVHEARAAFDVAAADLRAQASAANEAELRRTDAALTAREATRARIDSLGPEIDALVRRPL